LSATATKSFVLTVLTAERELFSGTVASVTLPTEAGELTLLPHHTALVSNLHAGELQIKSADGKSEELFIGGGVLEFDPSNACRVLADVGERVAEIDEKAAEEARKRAEAAVKDAEGTPEVAAAQAALLHAIARLRIAEKSRKFRK
jgi:F-type H+-transporting ATPase subunit epsilon